MPIMSPRKEYTSPDLSERKSHQNPEALFQKARKRGQMDLSQFSQEEQQKLYDWYVKSSSTLDFDDRMEFLEQCIAHNIIDDKKLLTHIEKFTQTLSEPESDDDYNDAKLSLRTIGEYLAFMKNPAYLQSLWACWHEIPYQAQENLKKYCTQEHPEQALLIAPFTNMGRLYIFISKTGEKKTIYRSRMIDARNIYYENRRKDEEEKKFIDAHLGNFEDAQPFIENLLTYCEKNRKELYSDSPAIENLRAMNKIFLFPYLKRIESLGLDTLIFPKELPRIWEKEKEGEKEKTTIELFIQKENIPYCSPDHFLTKKERQEIERLRKEFIAHNPEMGERLTADPLGSLAIQEMLPPEKHRRALMRILDDSTIRATHTILDSFQNYRHHLTEKEQQEFLLECLERNYPIFAVVDKLGLSKESVADLFKKAALKSYGCFPLNILYTSQDSEALLAFDRSHPGKPDLEKLMTTWLTKNLSDGATTNGLEYLMRYGTDTVFPHFSQENQEKIIQAIDKDFPSFWINNIPFALERSKTPFHTLLNSMSEYDFFKHYHQLIYHVQELEKKGIQTGVTVEDIRQCVRTAILSHPAMFFAYPQVVKENLTDAEQKEYIDSRLTPPVSSRFFIELLTSSFKDAYTERCKKIIEGDPILLDACMHSYSESVKKLIGNKKVLTYAMKKMASDPEIVNELFDQRDLFEELARSQSSIPALLKKIHETGSYTISITLLKETESLLSHIAYAKKNKQKAPSDISEKRLREIRSLFIDAVRAACDKNPLLIFHKDMRGISELNPIERISHHADAYFVEHPEELLERGWRDKKFIYEELLGRGKFVLLTLRHARSLALSGELSPEDLSYFEEYERERLLSINPSLRVLSQERLSGDFYDAILSETKNSTFFPLYEKRLREIAVREYELYGKQDIPKDVSVPDEYKELLKHIALLEQNECARSNHEFFLQLPEKQRDRILQTLEFLSAHGIDEGLSFNPSIESIDALQSRIQTRMHTFFEYTFDIRLSDSACAKVDILSVEGLGALIIYYKKTCSEHPEMKDVMQRCVSHVIDGTYELWKLPSIDTLHTLQKEKLLPAHLTREQYDAWKKEDTIDMEEVIEYDIAGVHFGIREIFDQAVADGHIDPALLSQSMHELQNHYLTLTEPLQRMTNRQKELQAMAHGSKKEIPPEQQDEYDALKQDIARYMADHRSELARIKALHYLHELKKISAYDIEERMLTTEEKKRIPFSEIFKTIGIAFQEDFPYFAGDMARVQSVLSEGHQNMFSGQRVSKTKLFITDKIDFETYARIGEKPVTSCQHYNSKTSRGYNRGLLSYLTDPNLKIIQVYDANKKIIARAILRLVSTQKGDPALFAERVYSANSHPKINEAITQYVQRKAEAMGIPYAMTEHSKISESLFQTGSRSPFVYTDAGGGVVPHGVFEILSTATMSFKFKGPEPVLH